MAKHVFNERMVKEIEYGYTCDDCQKEIADTQESLHWQMCGGYGSVFGDGTEMTLDLCQDCVKARLGDVIQFHGNAYFDAVCGEGER